MMAFCLSASQTVGEGCPCTLPCALADIPTEELPLSVRDYNGLKRNGVECPFYRTPRLLDCVQQNKSGG